MRDDIARLDGIAFDQFGHGRGDGRLVVDEMAHAGTLEKGDAPAVMVGIGMAAAHGEAGKTKDNVRGDIAIHSEKLAHGLFAAG